MRYVLAILSTIILNSCAVGAATSGASIWAYSAHTLSAETEQRIVDRVKCEIYTEMDNFDNGNDR